MFKIQPLDLGEKFDSTLHLVVSSVAGGSSRTNALSPMPGGGSGLRTLGSENVVENRDGRDDDGESEE